MSLIQTIKESAPVCALRRAYYAVKDWDETKKVLKIRRDIRRFKGTAKRKACVVIGNGPSLRVEDLTRLRELKIPTFACNRVYLAFSQTPWRPDYYFLSDAKLLDDFQKSAGEGKNFPCFYPRRLEKEIPEGHFYLEQPFDYQKEGRFSLDAAKGIFPGGSVTTEMLQFAYYMGYKEVYLIGVDFNYEVKTPKADGTYAYQGENNYFIKGYLKPGEIAAMPNVAANLLAFDAARRVAGENGCVIRNATRGGKLEVFERADLDALFARWEKEKA